ncbi:MAG TPA: elongation factor P maturation arginine rhamnosyltransferase EarP [Burkholderiales bacterium]|nr:elongation factor P maturation arginine rhamnosyltransferase EarP [Burkholderiales bacterium]
MRNTERWDIFCRVVDNFGDAGVCWRLARILAAEHGFDVRVCIDDVATLARLQPQATEGLEVVCWGREGDIPADGVTVIVEAFGCGVPDAYLEDAARQGTRPLWIVLEYLSAEAWVPEHHGLPSPHPRLPIERWFFFPGFTPRTGGLLRERDLLARRDAFGAEAGAACWRELGFAPPAPSATTVLVFAYPFAPLSELLAAWADGPDRVVAAIPDSALAAEALRFFGATGPPQDRTLTRGALEVRFVPFVPQARFDELLWSCDVLFVRGEDSIVRAQWAARPFVWHIYAQEEQAHRRKLEAFVDAYCAGLEPAAAAAVRDLMLAWNHLDGGRVSVGSAWAAYARLLPVLERHGREWSERLVQAGELAAKLALFSADKLK